MLLREQTLFYLPVNPSLNPPKELRLIVLTAVALQRGLDTLQDLRPILLGELTSLYRPVKSPQNPLK